MILTNQIMERILRFVFTTTIVTFILVVSTVFFNRLLNIPLYMDNEFKSYYENFKRDAKDNKVAVDFSMSVMHFASKLDDNVVAFCTSDKEIVVSKELWDLSSNLYRKWVLYHEWGHCILKRDHYETVITGLNCPDSIMYSSAQYAEKCYDILHEWYILELFTNPRNAPLINN